MLLLICFRTFLQPILLRHLFCCTRRNTIILMNPAINYYHKALHLGCCSSPRSASESITYSGKTCQSSLPSVPSLPRSLSLQCLMYISDFHSDENSSSNYSWNPYERESQLSLPKEVEKH